jgi:hypothetical protein
MINVEKFKNLSKEEIFSKLTEVNEYWVNYFYFNKTQVDKEKLELFVDKIYKDSNLPVPNIKYDIISDNTKDKKSDDVVLDNVFEKWFEKILLSIYNDSNLMKGLKSNNLFDELNNYIVNNTEFYIRYFSFKFYNDNDEYYINHNYQNYNLIILYDLFRKLDVINDDNLNDYLNFCELGVFSIVTKPDSCIVYSCPSKLVIDDDKRLHNEDSSALIFNDIEKYYWHGVEINSNYVLDKDSLTKNDIVNEKNAEKRRCLKEILGSKKYAELLNIEIIDEDIDAKGNPVRLYKTKEVDDIINKHLYFANVICPSTGREYFLSVPESDNIWNSVAYTFQMNKDEYKLTNES